MNETVFQIEVRPRIPEELARLNELAGNLLYSWDREVRGLFYRLDPQLWETCDHSPKVFLRRVSQRVLEDAARDEVFMQGYHHVLFSVDSYLAKKRGAGIAPHLDQDHDLVAYFCAEFGLHESFRIYSGGLGILAGDHCKACSDMGVPFVAVGLLYRQGYFHQNIDGCGNQVAHYHTTSFGELPIEPALDRNGKPVQVMLDLPGRKLRLRAWCATAGHIRLYLLDSNLDDNSEDDRQITFQLYGGDRNTRMLQELVLGLGGVQMLRMLGLRPTVWHINEGHAAFQILERCREIISDEMDFASALEQVACGTVFTTHTPVPAGHDMFDQHLIGVYFSEYLHHLRISFEEFMDLGVCDGHPGMFNMTALALRGSRFHNGVSLIHGRVASHMESYIWPQIPPQENPLTHVTNGVHAPTFLAREWINLFDMYFSEWRNRLCDDDYWSCIEQIPDHRFWSLRQELKSQMLEDVCRRTMHRYRRNQCNEALQRQVVRFINNPESDVLVLGFARRFATYKRATLIFSDPARLARLLNDPERPVLLIFAGKAHPADEPGRQLIRTIHEIAHRPEFLGRIILLEDYNMAMARRLVTGVDVWVNNPEYPLEASGTSGQKAAINGVLNLSVLDGWWAEGYDPEHKNGWGIAPHGVDKDPAQRDREEANDLLDTLEHEVIPVYYNRGNQGYSRYWVKMSRNAMRTCIPRFNAERMVLDYVKKLYGPAKRQYQRIREEDSAPARELAGWKRKIRERWDGVRIRLVSETLEAIMEGESALLRVKLNLNGLEPGDVRVECMVDKVLERDRVFANPDYHPFHYVREEEGSHLFELQLSPRHPGLNQYRIRAFPCHELLSHPAETGRMIWI